MAFTAPTYTRTTPESTVASHQAFQILHFGYVVLPLVAGVDKYFHFLTDWNKYLAPQVSQALRMEPAKIMAAVGVVEIVAALLVAVAPRIGAYFVAAWLFGIVGNLVIHSTQFWDVALRDVGLMLGALALGRLAQWEWSRKHVPPAM